MPTVTRPSTFSVIIPARNAGKTLEACLKAVFKSTLLPDEVLVINDSSQDRTRDVAGRFNCRLIDVCFKTGPMEPRFAGAKAAKHPILVFIDADVCVRKNTFSSILEHFLDPALDALTGTLSADTKTGSFFGDYKNEYMNYIFSRQPKHPSFLYGSIWAIRKDRMILFRAIQKPFGSLVADSEMGFRLRRKNRKLLLDTTLVVDHIKQHTLASLVQNDFIIPFLFAKMFVRYRGWDLIWRHRRFSHVSRLQPLEISCGALSTWCLMAGLAGAGNVFFTAGIWLFILFSFSLLPFLRHLKQRRPLSFMISAFLFKWLDANIMWLGIGSGFALSAGYLFTRRISFKKKTLHESTACQHPTTQL